MPELLPRLPPVHARDDRADLRGRQQGQHELAPVLREDRHAVASRNALYAQPRGHARDLLAELRIRPVPLWRLDRHGLRLERDLVFEHMPLAAGIGSTATGCPSAAVRPVPIMRAIMSDAPPAGFVTMVRMGRRG